MVTCNAFFYATIRVDATVSLRPPVSLTAVSPPIVHYDIYSHGTYISAFCPLSLAPCISTYPVIASDMQIKGYMQQSHWDPILPPYIPTYYLIKGTCNSLTGTLYCQFIYPPIIQYATYIVSHLLHCQWPKTLMGPTYDKTTDPHWGPQEHWTPCTQNCRVLDLV